MVITNFWTPKYLRDGRDLINYLIQGWETFFFFKQCQLKKKWFMDWICFPFKIKSRGGIMYVLKAKSFALLHKEYLWETGQSWEIAGRDFFLIHILEMKAGSYLEHREPLAHRLLITHHLRPSPFYRGGRDCPERGRPFFLLKVT